MQNGCIIHFKCGVMHVTLTVKQVPKALAERLRRRAAQNRRSLQRELLLILETAADAASVHAVGEPTHAPYHVQLVVDAALPHKRQTGKSAPPVAGKLTLDTLWQRARKLGASTPAESAAIIRRDRDARQRR